LAKRYTAKMAEIERRKKSEKGNKQFSFARDAWRRLKRNKTAIVGMVIIAILLLLALFADLIAPYGPSEAVYADAYQTPNAKHIFGTDNMGRDLFSRCIYGSRYSLPIGIACMILAFTVGGIIGVVSSFFGGRTDMIVMRVMDIMQAIPATLLAITIVAVLDAGIPQLICAVTIAFIPAFSKTMRAAIFTVRNNEYIEACRSIGASNMRLMLRHMVPNAIGHVIIFAVGIVSASILSISMLSYIGLGIKAPAPEWGSILNSGREFIQNYPHMVLFPGLFILFTVLAFNLLGDGLRDALDPRLK
jgi:ABC-type dipeptide/oligopeptide/nickel transport system permease subunit